MAEQCFAYARRKWNAAYPDNPLTTEAHSSPQLWDIAEEEGYSTSDDAVAKSIACWDYGTYGHVAWVIKNNGDGTMKISESNWPVGTGPTTRTIDIGDRGKYTLLGFVYP